MIGSKVNTAHSNCERVINLIKSILTTSNKKKSLKTLEELIHLMKSLMKKYKQRYSESIDDESDEYLNICNKMSCYFLANYREMIHKHKELKQEIINIKDKCIEFYEAPLYIHIEEQNEICNRTEYVFENTSLIEENGFSIEKELQSIATESIRISKKIILDADKVHGCSDTATIAVDYLCDMRDAIESVLVGLKLDKIIREKPKLVIAVLKYKRDLEEAQDKVEETIDRMICNIEVEESLKI